jgi:hypothetical protein
MGCLRDLAGPGVFERQAHFVNSLSRRLLIRSRHSQLIDIPNPQITGSCRIEHSKASRGNVGGFKSRQPKSRPNASATDNHGLQIARLAGTQQSSGKDFSREATFITPN